MLLIYSMMNLVEFLFIDKIDIYIYFVKKTRLLHLIFKVQ